MSNIINDGSWMVEYFEIGCRCIDSSRIKKPLESLSNESKLEYYIQQCTCTRHPESARRHCWDRKLQKAC